MAAEYATLSLHHGKLTSCRIKEGNRRLVVSRGWRSKGLIMIISYISKTVVNWSESVVTDRAMKVAEAAAGRVGPVFVVVEKLFRHFLFRHFGNRFESLVLELSWRRSTTHRWPYLVPSLAPGLNQISFFAF